MRLRFFMFFLIAAWACTAKKNATTVPLVQSPPHWVEQRPTNPSFYTGIGVAPINSSNEHLRVAKENALSDLASEIEVVVKSNSLLHTLETNSQFTQAYSESIRISSNLALEDFEIVDTWTDAHSYWIYYRLNKETYAHRIQQKKAAAQNLALEYLTNAETAVKNNAFTAATDYYLMGLQALENFWNEPHRISYKGKDISLDNYLYTQVKNLLISPAIEVENYLELNFNNNYKASANVAVTTGSGMPLSNIPLAYAYTGEYGYVRGKTMTNNDGRAEITIDRAAKNHGDNALQVVIDTEKIFKPFAGDQFMRQLTSAMPGAESVKKITYKPPVIYIESQELNLGYQTHAATIESAMIASFARKGIGLTTNADAADIKLILKANTKKSGSDNELFTSTLQVRIEVWELPKGNLRYQISKDHIKGVDLNFEKAGLKSYQNFIKNIESEIMRQLASHLL